MNQYLQIKVKMLTNFIASEMIKVKIKILEITKDWVLLLLFMDQCEHRFGFFVDPVGRLLIFIVVLEFDCITNLIPSSWHFGLVWLKVELR